MNALANETGRTDEDKALELALILAGAAGFPVLKAAKEKRRDLPGLGRQEISVLPVEMLAILQRELGEQIERSKAAKARLDDALALRYGDRAAAVRRGAGKDTGAVRFDDGDFTVVADLTKKVDWNQDRLATLVERIRAAGDDPAKATASTGRRRRPRRRHDLQEQVGRSSSVPSEWPSSSPWRRSILF